MKKPAYWMIFAASCGLVSSAIAYGPNTAGLFFSSMAAAFATGRGNIALSSTIYSLTMAVCGMFATRTIQKTGFKKAVWFFTLLQIISTALLAFVPKLWMIYPLSFLRGLCGGMIGLVIASVLINSWFHKNTALYTSISMGFSGIISALASPVLSRIIAARGYQSAYLLLSILILAFNLPAMLFPITLDPKECGMKAYGETETSISGKQKEKDSRTVSSLVLPLLMGFAILNASGIGIPQHFSGIAESYGLMNTGSLMASANMITNTAGKLILGAMIDKIGCRLSVSIFLLLILAASVSILLLRNAGLLILAALFYGLIYSLATVACSSMCREIYGADQYASTYSKLAFATSASSAVFTTLTGSVYDLLGSYAPILIATEVFLFLAFVCMQTAYRLQEKK